MPSTPTSQSREPGFAFALSFILCVIVVADLVSRIPASYLVAWRDLTMTVTRVLGTLLGLAMTSKADILTVNGFAMRIISQCTALDYVAILATAILLYRRHTLSYRLTGICLAVPIIVCANALRLIITGLVGTFSRDAFDFVHDYLWVIGFALIVFALWSFWVNGRLLVSRAAAGRLALVLAVSLGAYALFFLFQDSYGRMMAAISSGIFGLLNDNPQVAILWNGSEIVCSQAGASIMLMNLSEQVNLIVYAGLMAPLQRKGDWEMLGLTALGLVAILVTDAVFIALGCSQGLSSGAGSLVAFLKTRSVIHLALPMTIFWIMSSGREQGKLAPGEAAPPSGCGPQQGKHPGKGKLASSQGKGVSRRND